MNEDYLDNLLEETLEELTTRGKTPADVLWCGGDCCHFWFTWEDFARVAADTSYDSGFGDVEIATDLVVVGADWWLERHEVYDGAERWVFKTLPSKPENYRVPEHFTLRDKPQGYYRTYLTLEEMHEPEEQS